MAAVDRQAPNTVLDTKWASLVAHDLCRLSLLYPGLSTDLSLSRVTVNVTLFLNNLRQWDQEKGLWAQVGDEGRRILRLLFGIAAQLLEDLKARTDEVHSSRQDQGAQHGPDVSERREGRILIKSQFSQPGVKTILALLQYIQITASLIVHVVLNYNLLQTDPRRRGSEDSDDGRDVVLSEKIYIRSLVISRQVALRYIEQRVSVENGRAGSTASPPTTPRRLPSKSTSKEVLSSDVWEELRHKLEFLEGAGSGIAGQEDFDQHHDKLINTMVHHWTRLGSDSSGENDFHIDLSDQTIPIPKVSASLGQGQHSERRLPLRSPTVRQSGGDIPVAAASTRQSPTQQPSSQPATARTKPASDGSFQGLPAGPQRRPSAIHTNLRVVTESYLPPLPPSSYSALPKTATTASSRPPNSGSMLDELLRRGCSPYGSTPTSNPETTRPSGKARAQSSSYQGTPTSGFEPRDSGVLLGGSRLLNPVLLEDDIEAGTVNIHWRIGVGSNYWEYENDKLMRGPLTSSLPTLDKVDAYLYSHDSASTEIESYLVSESVVKEKYSAVLVPSQGGTAWQIQQVLRFHDVKALVDLSTKLKHAERIARPGPSSAQPNTPLSGKQVSFNFSSIAAVPTEEQKAARRVSGEQASFNPNQQSQTQTQPMHASGPSQPSHPPLQRWMSAPLQQSPGYPPPPHGPPPLKYPNQPQPSPSQYYQDVRQFPQPPSGALVPYGSAPSQPAYGSGQTLQSPRLRDQRAPSPQGRRTDRRRARSPTPPPRRSDDRRRARSPTPPRRSEDRRRRDDRDRERRPKNSDLHSRHRGEEVRERSGSSKRGSIANALAGILSGAALVEGLEGVF